MSITSTAFGQQNSLLQASHAPSMRAETDSVSSSAQNKNGLLASLEQQAPSLPSSGDVTVYGSGSSIKDSRYISGLMTGYRIDNEFQNRLQGIVTQHQSMLEGVDSYAMKALIGKKAEEATKRYGEQYVTEKETERVEEERKQTEKEAEEKLQKKIEGNGEDETKDTVAPNDPENKISADEAEITSAQRGAEKVDATKGQSAPTAVRTEAQSSNAPTPRQATAAQVQQAEPEKSASNQTAHIDLRV